MARIPGYRLHKASSQAIVKLGGKLHYLGKHGSPESKRKYAEKIAEWFDNPTLPPMQPPGPGELTIIELCERFRRHAVEYYRKGGRPTGELGNFDMAMRPLLLLFGEELVKDFGPKKLKAVRELMVQGFTDRAGKDRSCLPRIPGYRLHKPSKQGMVRLDGKVHYLGPHGSAQSKQKYDRLIATWTAKRRRPPARSTVNSRIRRLKQIFRWAVEEELAPGELLHALRAVANLKKGRSEARDSEPIKPVDDDQVEATLEHLAPIVAHMARVQRLTGCRPDEVCSMRPVDIDQSPNPQWCGCWMYAPQSHKTEHREQRRSIFIGPRAQAILKRYLYRPPAMYCFSPAESEARRKAEMRLARKSPVQPSQRDRSKTRPRRKPRDRYTTASYRRAVTRACDLADKQAHVDDAAADPEIRLVPRWTPNQLRHSCATEIRASRGLEASQVVLGHSRADVTQVYAERNARLAAEVISKIG
jgi:integrase